MEIPLEIKYKNGKLEKLSLISKVADRELGPKSAQKLRTRLAEIDAGSSVAELIAGRPHPLKGNRLGEFALDLAGGDRLVFMPSANPPPLKDDGGIDWSNVKSVTIIFIGDYHD